ncbi:MAG: efflux RND transporter permease subunit, partial [Bacteroidetes bacterium]|nr:efflux RND transporter permease subunit [Bacteroidota bacterium]
MKNIISYFIKYPISADVLVLLILVFGLLGVMSTRSTFFPETETELISVRTIFPGASPEEV